MTSSPDNPEFWHQYMQVLDWMITSAPAYKKMRADVIQHLAPTAGRAYLDIGCGTGGLLVDLVAASPQSKGLGIDFSSAALEIARRKVNGIEQVEFRELDFTRGLPLPDRSIAGTASINSLYVACPQGDDGYPLLAFVLGEIKRVLQPGGKLVIAAPNPKGWGGKFFQKAVLGSIEHYALILRYEGMRGMVERSAAIWRNREMVRVISQTNRTIAERYEFLDQQQYRRALEVAGLQVQETGKTRTGNMVIVAAATGEA